MAAIINADDGAISGASGLKLSSDTSGALNIQTNGVTAIAISASQAVSFPATTSLNFTSANITTLTSSSATITNLLATSLTVSSGSTLNGGVVINEPGADVDFRVEGDTDANLVFVDASADAVGISTNAPATKLHLGGATNKSIRIDSANGNAGFFGTYQNETNIAANRNPSTGTFTDTAKAAATIKLNANNLDGNITFATTASNNTEPTQRAVIDKDGNVGIGTTSPATKLDVRGIVYTDNQYRVGTNSAGANTGIIKWNAGDSLGIYTWSDALDIQIGGSNVLFKTEAGTERARVTSDGNFLVGMTARPIAISNAIGYKNAANGVSSGTGMNGSTWVDLVTLPTPSIAGARINILGNENSNINTYFGMWVIAYNSSGWGITGPFNENQRGNDYGVPNLRISGGKIQVQARNGVSNGLIYYNIEYFSV